VPTMHVVYPLGCGVGAACGRRGSRPGSVSRRRSSYTPDASAPVTIPNADTPTFNPRERDIYIRYVLNSKKYYASFVFLNFQVEMARDIAYRLIKNNDATLHCAVS
jgi:hypothetical protein